MGRFIVAVLLSFVLVGGCAHSADLNLKRVPSTYEQKAGAPLAPRIGNKPAVKKPKPKSQQPKPQVNDCCAVPYIPEQKQPVIAKKPAVKQEQKPATFRDRFGTWAQKWIPFWHPSQQNKK